MHAMQCTFAMINASHNCLQFHIHVNVQLMVQFLILCTDIYPSTLFSCTAHIILRLIIVSMRITNAWFLLILEWARRHLHSLVLSRTRFQKYTAKWTGEHMFTSRLHIGMGFMTWMGGIWDAYLLEYGRESTLRNIQKTRNLWYSDRISQYVN